MGKKVADMEEIRIGYLLKQLKVALEQKRKENMDDLDITPSQCFMLRYLLTQDGSRMYASDIYKALGISRVSVSVILNGLCKKGYLTMEDDFWDERRKKISLTKKAYETQEEIGRVLKKREEQMCEGISQEDIKLFEAVLNRMILNLKKKNGDLEEMRQDKGKL